MSGRSYFEHGVSFSLGARNSVSFHSGTDGGRLSEVDNRVSGSSRVIRPLSGRLSTPTLSLHPPITGVSPVFGTQGRSRGV